MGKNSLNPLCQKGSLFISYNQLFLLGFLVFYCGAALADSPKAPLGEQVPSIGDALDKAYAYTFETGGIAMVMSYGTKNGSTAEEIGDAFVNELEKRGYTSRYFYYISEGDGVGMTFRIGYSSLGPWGANTAASKIVEVTNIADAAYKIHGGSK